MAFDRDAFLAAFLNQMSSGIAKQREDAEKYKEQQELAAERNRQLISTRNARASAAVSLANQALQYLPEGGNSKAMVQTAIASGMTGIQEFRDKLAKAHAEAGLAAGERLPIDDVEAIVSMPNIPSIDQSLLDMTLEEFAKETYGAKAKATPVEDDTSVIGQLFGFGAKDRVKEELRERDAFDGMSIADVNAAARMNEFNSIIPNAVMSFAEMERFGRNDAIRFTRDITDAHDKAFTSSEADDAAKVARFAYQQTEEGKNASPTQIQQVENIARKAYAQKVIKRMIETEAGIYGNMLVNNQIAADQIKELMGETYYFNLYDDYVPVTEEEKEAVGLGLGPSSRGGRAKFDIEEETTIPEVTEEGEGEPVTPEEGDGEGEPDTPPTPPVIEPVEPRPGGRRGFASKQRAWDAKYGGKFDPVTGEPIIVEPRPADGGPAEGRGRNKKTAAEKWDSKYGDTHNPDGTPKAVEE